MSPSTGCQRAALAATGTAAGTMPHQGVGDGEWGLSTYRDLKKILVGGKVAEGAVHGLIKVRERLGRRGRLLARALYPGRRLRAQLVAVKPTRAGLGHGEASQHRGHPG